MWKVTVEFHGPLAWIRTAGAEFIFEAEIARSAGVYLWTVETAEGYLIWYVGETGASFRHRMRDHFREQLSGMYMVYDPDAFARGEKRLVWQGMYRRGEERRVPEFLEALPDIWPAVVDLAKALRFFVAPLDCDRRLRKRIEAAIAAYLYAQPGAVGAAQDRGIRYEAPRWPNEEPLELTILSSSPLRGLPNALLI